MTVTRRRGGLGAQQREAAIVERLDEIQRELGEIRRKLERLDR